MLLSFVLALSGNILERSVLGFYLLIFLISAVTMLISLGMSVLMYILFGKGTCKMASKLGISDPSGAYIPFYRHKIFGELSDAAAMRDGRPHKKMGKLLMWLNFCEFISIVLFNTVYIVWVIAAFFGDGSGGVLHGWSYVGFVLTFAILLASILMLAIFVATAVLRYIAYARIFKCFSPDLWVLWLLLAIFFTQAAGPILLICLSKSEPAPCGYSGERQNY